MPEIEKILEVAKIIKPDVYNNGKRVAFYTFKTDGIPGHNTYQNIPEYQIDGKPRVGFFAKYLLGGNSSETQFAYFWKIIKSNENIK